MQFLDIVREHLFGYNSFFYWRNFIEIIFFTLIVYYFSLWLNCDKKKNLLLYFYSYSFIMLASYYFQLTTISYLLFLFSPVSIMIFILLHQTTLQKNFIALKNIVPSKATTTDWPQELIRSFLFAINNNKEIYCIVEKNDNLQDFITCPLCINADTNNDLINILLQSNSFNQSKMIWVNAHGNTIGINAEWQENIFENQENINAKYPEIFKQNAILLSSKTDSLFLSITPQERKFDVIFKGDVFNNINSDNIINIIKKYACYNLNEKCPESGFSEISLTEKSLTKTQEKLKGEFLNERSKKDLSKQRSN